MHARGARRGPSKAPESVPATDDEIQEKYLERAIRELNALTRRAVVRALPARQPDAGAGLGPPQADIFMLKFAPVPSEIEEGVAFYGRAGSALMKSFKRLGIDPLAVYGTVFVKCPVADTDMAAPECKARVLDELAIVQPKIVVVMGEEALEELNGLGVPLAAPVEPEPGAIQKLTASCDALYVPDIDASLDDESAKRAFWGAFKSLGDSSGGTRSRTSRQVLVPSRRGRFLLPWRTVQGERAGDGQPHSGVARAARGAEGPGRAG